MATSSDKPSTRGPRIRRQQDQSANSKATGQTTKARPLPRVGSAIRTAFHGELLTWYQRHKRDLPWRHTRDPYALVVSEVMLQQTQVATALPYYERWLKEFPNWSALAKAPEQRLLKAWEGLGYYNRARNLQKLGLAVIERGGQLPTTSAALRELPGIGEYTARAVASFAFGEACAVLDGNVIRILTRVFDIADSVSEGSTKTMLWRLVDKLAPLDNCADFNQAIMELGALICSPRSPQCLVCPLRAVCRTRAPEERPVKHATTIKNVAETIAILRKGKTYWCEKPTASGRLRSLWRFPDLDAATMRPGKVLTAFTYGITNHRVALTARLAEWHSKPPATQRKTNGRWLTLDEIAELPFSAAHRRIANLLGK